MGESGRLLFIIIERREITCKDLSSDTEGREDVMELGTWTSIDYLSYLLGT